MIEVSEDIATEVRERILSNGFLTTPKELVESYLNGVSPDLFALWLRAEKIANSELPIPLSAQDFEYLAKKRNELFLKAAFEGFDLAPIEAVSGID